MRNKSYFIALLLICFPIFAYAEGVNNTHEVPYKLLITKIVIILMLIWYFRGRLLPSRDGQFVRKLSTFLVSLFNNIDLIILTIGSAFIAYRVFYPPKYYLIQGIRFPYDESRRFAPISDYETAILHAIGIAVITGILYFIVRKMKLSSKQNGT